MNAMNPSTHRLMYRMRALLQLSAIVLAASPSLAATWKTNVNYGGSGTTMDLYVPDAVDASPGIVVALHYCGGSAAAAHSWFQSLSDKYGFIVIAADAANNCWDSSPARSGEKAAIVQMVNYVISQYKADKSKVFSAGASSGACMTNTLLAAYPDVFAAGSVLAGVPVGAWPSGNTSCSGVCNTTPPSKTAAAWGDIVRNAYPYSGARPRVQLFHGSNDEYLYYGYLAEEVKQWTNVLAITDTGAKESNKPSTGWERTSYKNTSGTVALEVNSKQGEVHDLTGKGLFPDVVRFFGLDVDSPGTGGTSATGGASSTGGVKSTGGTSSVGGTKNTGGTENTPTTASGGALGKGGATSTGAPITGGATSTIPVSSGGSITSNSGGTPTTTSAISGNGGSIIASATTPLTNAGTSTSTATTPGGTDSGEDGGCSMTITKTRIGSGSLAAFAALLASVALLRRRRGN